MEANFSTNVLMIHNEYGIGGGEETAVDGIQRMPLANGHEVMCFVRRIKDILDKSFGRMRVLVCGIWNPQVGHEFAQLLSAEKADVIQTQNVYPVISPIVFEVAWVTDFPNHEHIENFIRQERNK